MENQRIPRSTYSEKGQAALPQEWDAALAFAQADVATIYPGQDTPQPILAYVVAAAIVHLAATRRAPLYGDLVNFLGARTNRELQWELSSSPDPAARQIGELIKGIPEAR